MAIKGRMETAIARCDMQRTVFIEVLKLAIADGDVTLPKDLLEQLAELDKLEKEKDQIILGLLQRAE